MRIRGQRQTSKTNLDMTSMIDVVFQLLAFFVMTFQIVAPEGDFNIRMPTPGTSAEPTPVALVPPLRVRLHADDSGQLASIELADRRLGSMDALRTQVRHCGRSGGRVRVRLPPALRTRDRCGHRRDRISRGRSRREIDREGQVHPATRPRLNQLRTELGTAVARGRSAGKSE